MLNSKMQSEEKVETLLSRGQIPIIDLGHCGTEYCPRSMATRLSSQLKKALSEKGVAFLVNHGISQTMLKTCWSHLDTFCDLPTDIKEHYIRKGDDNHGYVQPGVERFNGKTPELRHAYNICTLAAASLPEEPIPGFREHVADLATEFKKLAKLILQALAHSLELEPNFFVEKHSHMLSGNHENATTLRLLYYPPVVEDDNHCELIKGSCMYSYQKCATDRLNLDDLSSALNDHNDEDDLNNTITRCGAHCDYGTFTLLAQDSEGGLEVKLPNSQKWQRVGHLPGAILINSGEMMEMWTSGKYPALNHRVVVPKQITVRSRGRHSLAYFCHPDNIIEIKPIFEDCVKTSNSDESDSSDKPHRKKSLKTAKNKFVNAYQFVQRRFRDTYTS